MNVTIEELQAEIVRLQTLITELRRVSQSQIKNIIAERDEAHLEADNFRQHFAALDTVYFAIRNELDGGAE